MHPFANLAGVYKSGFAEYVHMVRNVFRKFYLYFCNACDNEKGLLSQTLPFYGLCDSRFITSAMKFNIIPTPKDEKT